MVRRRSFTSISGVALTGSRTMISATRTSPREPERCATAKSSLLVVRCDVASERSVQACIDRTLRRFGRLDALISNAGIASPETGPVQRLALREWNRRLAVNLTGMFLMAKHAAVALRRAR